MKVAHVKDIDRELVDMIRIAETASDEDIQRKLRELYSSERDQEKMQHAQKSVLSKISQEEGSAILSVASSRVRVDNDQFRARLVRGILADDDYLDIYEKPTGPHSNERGDRERPDLSNETRNS